MVCYEYFRSNDDTVYVSLSMLLANVHVLE